MEKNQKFDTWVSNSPNNNNKKIYDLNHYQFTLLLIVLFAQAKISLPNVTGSCTLI